MSSCQDLLASQQDFALLAPSWQAGVSGYQYTQKSWKKIDVESVNIVKTCEKLNLALNNNSKYIQNSAHTIDDNEGQCAIRRSDISFRDFSNIWFGTLKIYQQQVNTLFRLSQDLFSRSGSCKSKPLIVRKRNSSLTSQKLIKKRCLTFNESCLKTNYTKLLDDLEELTRESASTSLPEHFKNIPGSITQYQIREITMREINTTTFNHPEELDEDSGFGEATHEEIREFLNFEEGIDVLKMKKTTVKRKLTNVEDSPIKRNCLNTDFFAEPINDENISVDNHNLKRSNSQTHSIYEDNIYMNTTNGILDAGIIKKEHFSDAENSATICAKKKRMLIIDDCIKIDISDVIKSMKSSELLTKRPRKKIRKSITKTRNLTALELLTRFNRRSLKLTLSLKQKIFLVQEQFERDYLNLLRQIFLNYYKEEWASEIYPNWISFKNEQVKQKKKQRLNKFEVYKMINIHTDFNEVPIKDFVNNDSSEDRPALNSNDKMDMRCTNIYNWQPHDVMQKLVNLWRSNQTYTTAAYTLFKLAGNQIDRSLGFSSLLHLSKNRFVNLTTFPGSIELQNIEVGKTIKKNC